MSPGVKSKGEVSSPAELWYLFLSARTCHCPFLLCLSGSSDAAAFISQSFLDLSLFIEGWVMYHFLNDSWPLMDAWGF